MFLDVLRRRNPALVEAAIALHQAGRIPANCYVLDLDAVADNARAFRQRADALGLTVFAMTKQVGRNSGFCRALGRGGIDRAVAVDMACAQALRAAACASGTSGTWSRCRASRRTPPPATSPRNYWTVFSGAKASEAASAALRAGRTQKLLARIQAAGDTFYRGHEGGFDADDVAAVAAELDALDGARFAGITTLSGAAVRPRDRHRRAYPQSGDPEPRAEVLEKAGRSDIEVNAPGTTSSVVLQMLAMPARRSASRATGCTGPRPCTRSGTCPRCRPCST